MSSSLIGMGGVHPQGYLFPELGEDLGRFAERKLHERRVEVIKSARVASYDGSVVRLNDGTSIPAATLIWTAGAKPSAVIESLPCEKERDRLRVNEFLCLQVRGSCWTKPGGEPLVEYTGSKPPSVTDFGCGYLSAACLNFQWIPRTSAASLNVRSCSKTTAAVLVVLSPAATIHLLSPMHHCNASGLSSWYGLVIFRSDKGTIEFNRKPSKRTVFGGCTR